MKKKYHRCMRFSTFYLSPSLTTNLDDIRNLIKHLSFHMTEVFTPSPDTLQIGSLSEVIDSYESSRYIITETVLHDIVTHQIPEFPLQIHPIPVCQRISLCLSPLWILCVGFNTDEIMDINRKVSLLGGTLTRDFSENVTIVISHTNISPKVIKARKYNLPIVSKQWLDDCFSEVQRIPLTKNDYLLPPFHGITFTSTDLVSKTRRELKKLAVNNGGTWSDVYDDSITYLVAEGLSNTKKIGIALCQGVPIVRPTYLRNPSKFDVINWWCMSNQKMPLFDGFIFSIHKNCDNIDAIQEAIIAHSGEINKNATYLIVPHGFDTSKWMKSNSGNESESKKFSGLNFVTTDWLWACIENKKILPFDMSPLYQPLPFPCPIETAKNVTFYLSSSLNDESRKTAACLVRESGGFPVFKFTNNVQYTIAEKYNHELMKLEINQKVPVVSIEFVVQLLKTGKFPDPKLFQLGGKQKDAMMSKLCKIIMNKSKESENDVENMNKNDLATDSNLNKTDYERSDLESFTQDLTSTQNEVTIEVKYDSQAKQSQDTVPENSNKKDMNDYLRKNKKKKIHSDDDDDFGNKNGSSNGTNDDEIDPFLSALQNPL